MPRRQPLAPTLADSAFSVGHAASQGVPPKRLRAQDLQRPFRGVRTHGEASVGLDAPIGRCRAYLPRLSPDHCFSHTSAAAIHGMPLPPWLAGDERIHVTATAASSVPRARGVVGHSAEHLDSVVRLGLPVTSPLRTWRDLASCLAPDDLVAIADFMLGAAPPLASEEELRHVALAAGGRRGAPALRRAASRARAGVDSPMESRLRMLVLDAGLPEPMVNGDVRDRSGSWVARSDLVFETYRVVLEYEGREHWADQKRFLDDIDRRERIEAAGWRVIRIARRHIFSRRTATADLIRRVLRERGWTP
jgi:hypothetical protein